MERRKQQIVVLIVQNIQTQEVAKECQNMYKRLDSYQQATKEWKG